MTAFNEDFVKHLNINDEIEENNEFLISISSDEAQSYLKENQDIFENNVKTTEEKESHDYIEGYETADVVMNTTDIQNYFNYMEDGTILGNTTYKVNSSTEVDGKEDTTVGNFIMKASYIKEVAGWKVNKIYGIAPVSDQSSDTLFKK